MAILVVKRMTRVYYHLEKLGKVYLDNIYQEYEDHGSCFWWFDAIVKMLKKTYYYGEIDYKGELYKDLCSAIYTK